MTIPSCAIKINKIPDKTYKNLTLKTFGIKSLSEKAIYIKKREIMKNNYELYVKPILAELSPDACMELAYDETFKKFLKTMRNPFFSMRGKNKQNTTASYVYWSILDLYSRTVFFNPTKQGDLQNFRVIFPHGCVGRARQAYQKVADLSVNFDAAAKFTDMQTLVKYASLIKARKPRQM